MPDVISNTSPLQYLHQAGLLDLLKLLYRELVVPKGVAEELREGRTRGIDLPDPSLVPWMSVREVQSPALLPLALDLGQGEREVLAIAKESPDPLAILDDGLARQYARVLKIPLTGTLGVILKAKKAGHLQQVAPVVERLEALRFRLDPRTRAAMLKLAGE